MTLTPFKSWHDLKAHLRGSLQPYTTPRFPGSTFISSQRPFSVQPHTVPEVTLPSTSAPANNSAPVWKWLENTGTFQWWNWSDLTWAARASLWSGSLQVYLVKKGKDSSETILLSWSPSPFSSDGLCFLTPDGRTSLQKVLGQQGHLNTSNTELPEGHPGNAKSYYIKAGFCGQISFENIWLITN